MIKAVSIIGLLMVTSYSYATSNTSTISNVVVNEAVICTMDAKICEDGTYVGRIGPECEFSACPSSKNLHILKDITSRVCTKEYEPVCAKIATGIRCLTEPCPAYVKKTFSNKCMAENAEAVSINEGVCNNKKIIPGLKRAVISSAEAVEIKNISTKTMKSIQVNPQRMKAVNAIALAHNEEERKEILKAIREERINNMNEIDSQASPKIYEKDIAQEKVLEKRKEIISKKSEEVFSKFDFFINRISNILEKISKKNEAVKSPEVDEILEESKNTLEEANKLKSEAWIIFSEIATSETKEIAREKLLTVKKILAEARKNIRISFKGAREAIEILKNKV